VQQDWFDRQVVARSGCVPELSLGRCHDQNGTVGAHR
jgi:hypothetical protein